MTGPVWSEPGWIPRTAVYAVVAESEFGDYGLRCCRCHRAIGISQPYEAIYSAVYNNGDEQRLLVCVYCVGEPVFSEKDGWL